MAPKPKRAVANSASKTRRRAVNSLCRAQDTSKTTVHGGGGGGLGGGGGRTCSSVSDKMEALKSLIPPQNGERKADQLFQETADYIVLLRSQVLLLQRLITFYGSTDNHNIAV